MVLEGSLTFLVVITHPVGVDHCLSSGEVAVAGELISDRGVVGIKVSC